MKRALSFLLSLMVLIGAFAYRPPKAKALVTESTLFSILLGGFMVSTGFSFSGVNQTGQRLADAIWQEWLGFCDTVEFGQKYVKEQVEGLISSVVVAAPGVLQIPKDLAAAFKDFCGWFQGEHSLSDNSSFMISSGTTLTDNDGNVYELCQSNKTIGEPKPLYMYDPYVGTIIYTNTLSESKTIWFGSIDLAFSVDKTYLRIISEALDYGSSISLETNDLFSFYLYDSSVYLCYRSVKNPSSWSVGFKVCDTSYVGLNDSSLSVATGEVHYPATDTMTDEQSYAVTFDGVTATDLEGVLDDAVARILDGTLTAKGEITDALDVPQDLTWTEHVAEIWESVKALPQTISQAIVDAFTPDAELVQEIVTTFNGKFGWLETLHRFGTDLFGMTADSEPPVIYIHLEDATGKYNYGGTEKALDMSWYQPYKEDVDWLLSGFMYLAFLWLLFKRAPAIIRGGEMATDYIDDIENRSGPPALRR